MRAPLDIRPISANQYNVLSDDAIVATFSKLYYWDCGVLKNELLITVSYLKKDMLESVLQCMVAIFENFRSILPAGAKLKLIRFNLHKIDESIIRAFLGPKLYKYYFPIHSKSFVVNAVALLNFKLTIARMLAEYDSVPIVKLYNQAIQFKCGSQILANARVDIMKNLKERKMTIQYKNFVGDTVNHPLLLIFAALMKLDPIIAKEGVTSIAFSMKLSAEQRLMRDEIAKAVAALGSDNVASEGDNCVLHWHVSRILDFKENVIANLAGLGRDSSAIDIG